MSHQDWLVYWYNPEDDDYIAYITVDRIVEIGGVDLKFLGTKRYTSNEINQGIAVLQRWCRLNCTRPPRPVNVLGKTGMAFKNQNDALLFKLTWG